MLGSCAALLSYGRPVRTRLRIPISVVKNLPTQLVHASVGSNGSYVPDSFVPRVRGEHKGYPMGKQERLPTAIPESGSRICKCASVAVRRRPQGDPTWCFVRILDRLCHSPWILSQRTARVWRARDVEMAVSSAQKSNELQLEPLI